MLAKRMDQPPSALDTRQQNTDSIRPQNISSFPALQQQQQKHSASPLISLRIVSRISSPSQSSHLQYFAVLSVLLLLVHQSSLVQSRSILTPSSPKSNMLEDGTSRDSIQNEDIMEGTDIISHQSSLKHRVKRSLDDPVLWPNRIVPFVFEEPFARRYKNQVFKAMSVWSKKTCVQFKDRINEEYFVRIVFSDMSGCDSRIGIKEWPVYRGVGQPLRLSIDCLKNRGFIMHELGHVLGMNHEHQRSDRDEYLTINYSNVHPNFRSEFNIIDFTFNTPYDFASIMHYPLNLFGGDPSVNTMVIRPNATHLAEGIIVGQRHTVSVLDLYKINDWYQCNEELDKVIQDLNGDNVYSGEQVGLLATGDEFGKNRWLSCTERECTLDTCPGKKLRENDKLYCPFNIFTLHKLITNVSQIVMVGDAIVLEHKSYENSLNIVFNKNMFVSCDSKIKNCSISSDCTTDGYRFNQTFCQHNILIVRAEGKEDGQAITHRDVIGFEFLTADTNFPSSSPSPEQSLPSHNQDGEQCAFGCDPRTNKCEKELCTPPIEFGNNGLGLGPSLSENAQERCGKDLFLIKKF